MNFVHENIVLLFLSLLLIYMKHGVANSSIVTNFLCCLKAVPPKCVRFDFFSHINRNCNAILHLFCDKKFSKHETVDSKMLHISIGEKNQNFMNKAQKVDTWKLLNPFWDFTLKMVVGIHDLHISWILSGTKNHKMWGPPVVLIRDFRICDPLYFMI